MTELNLMGLKPLTSNQYDMAREAALKRVASRIGDRPTRKQFQREQGKLLNILDAFAIIIFIAAFVVSSLHISDHIAQLVAAQSTDQLYIGVHRVAYILMAEFSLIMFLVMFATASKSDWRRWVFLALAVLALVFLFVANLNSDIGALESVLPPLFTIGIGFRLEYLIARSIERARLVDEKYQTAIDIWERAQADVTTHPEYQQLLRSEIWQALVKKNRGYEDAPIGFRVMAVRRELERETWAKDFEAEPVLSFIPEGGEQPRPTNGPRGRSGNSAPDPAEAAYGPMIEPESVIGSASMTTPNGKHAV